MNKVHFKLFKIIKLETDFGLTPMAGWDDQPKGLKTKEASSPSQDRLRMAMSQGKLSYLGIKSGTNSQSTQ